MLVTLGNNPRRFASRIVVARSPLSSPSRFARVVRGQRLRFTSSTIASITTAATAPQRRQSKVAVAAAQYIHARQADMNR